MSVINFGSMNVDYVYTLDHFVAPGETTSSSKMEIFAGGKGLNQSIAIARAGGEVTHAGIYGKEGHFLIDMLKISGVDLSVLEEADAPNGHAIIQVDKHGENAIVLFPGTNSMIDEEYVDRVFEKVNGNERILFQNETSCIAYGILKAKEHGCKVIMNPAPMDEKVLSYPLELVDIFVVNLTEGQVLSGETKPNRILDTLNVQYPKAKIILTLGAQGSWFSNKETRFHIPSLKVDQVVDTTAAGDTFIGYYLANMDQGDKRALEVATKAAALCIGTMGAANSIPNYEDFK